MLNRKPVYALFLFCLIQCRSATNYLSNYNQHNAIWTESMYFRGANPNTGEKLTRAYIKAYAARLQSSRIKYAYIFAGPFDNEGHLPGYAFSDTAINSVKTLTDYYPDLVILPWIGGIEHKTVHLEDPVWVNNALQDTKKLVDTLHVRGVHIDFECILPGFGFIDTTIRPVSKEELGAYGGWVNAFHKRLRAVIPSAFISSVVTATSPGTTPWKRKTSMQELEALTNYVDQVSFLYYDTGIKNQKSFEDNCDSLLKDIALLRIQHSKTEFLIAIGTFINPMPELQKNRYLEFENVTNSLLTIRKLLDKKDYSKRLIDGIAIFCDWQTDKEEWEEFDVNWSRQ